MALGLDLQAYKRLEFKSAEQAAAEQAKEDLTRLLRDYPEFPQRSQAKALLQTLSP